MYSSTNRIGVYGWCKENFGRKTIGIKNHYFIVARRCVCHHCSEKNSFIRKSHIFRACNAKSLEVLPNNLRLNFPATPSHEIGIDEVQVETMRSIFDGGLKPERQRAHEVSFESWIKKKKS